MKLNIIKIKGLFIASAIFTLMALVPFQVHAVAQQPPGQVPILEPLQSPERPANPNYSKNIEDSSDNVQVQQKDAQTPVNKDQNNMQSIAENSGGHLWLWILLVLIVIGVIALLVWKKVINATAVIIAIPLISVLSLFAVGGYGLVNLAKAQSVPAGQPSVQRTIIEEGTTNDSNPLSSPKEQSNNLTANSSVIYALLAVGLVVVAIGAGSILLYDPQKMKSELKAKLRRPVRIK